MSYHPAEDAASSQTPTRLGRYELIGQLATGGMAEIHLARLAGEAGFEKTVVVKRLLPELVASKAFVAMFLEEGKLVARLDHPNVCEVHELGRDGAEYFLVMPYLDGVPASDFIARPRDPDRIAQLRVAAGIITQACAGLHHAHELKGPDGAPLGLVHRDVSPSNLFVTTAGVVKVLDFGIAKVHGGAETEAGTIKGKTQYMAPEQLLGEPLDRRCDVFALGIVLFELATHQRLFKRASDYLSARAILEEPIPRADSVDPAVPAAFADVIAQALDRSRDRRHVDARELAKAIEAAMAPHGGVASAEQIAAALAEWHGAELSAMRTRQAKVIAEARSRVDTAGSSVAKSPDDVPTQLGKLAADPSRVLTTPHPVVRPRRRLPWLLAVLVLAAAGTLAAVTMTRDTDPAHSVATRADAAIAAGDVTAVAVVPGDAAERVPADSTVAEPPPASTIAELPPAPKRPSPTTRKTTRAKRVDKATAVDTSTAGAAKPGMISIESTPYARIFVDGAFFGVTPLLKKPIAAGKHKIKAVLEDGRIKELAVDVPAGALARPIVLTW